MLGNVSVSKETITKGEFFYVEICTSFSSQLHNGVSRMNSISQHPPPTTLIGCLTSLCVSVCAIFGIDILGENFKRKYRLLSELKY